MVTKWAVYFHDLMQVVCRKAFCKKVMSIIPAYSAGRLVRSLVEGGPDWCPSAAQ